MQTLSNTVDPMLRGVYLKDKPERMADVLVPAGCLPSRVSERVNDYDDGSPLEECAEWKQTLRGWAWPVEGFCLRIIDLPRGFSAELNENNVKGRSGKAHRGTTQHIIP